MRRSVGSFLLIFSLLAVVALPGIAQETTADADATQEYTAVTFAGVQVFVDQETGRLRPPTPEEAQALTEAMGHMFEQRRETRAALPQKSSTGVTMYELDPSLYDFLVIHRGEDGSLHSNCVHGESQALELIEEPAPVLVNGREVQ